MNLEQLIPTDIRAAQAALNDMFSSEEKTSDFNQRMLCVKNIPRITYLSTEGFLPIETNSGEEFIRRKIEQN